MTTKAEVLAARAEYERVAVEFLLQQGWRYNPHDDLWMRPGGSMPVVSEVAIECAIRIDQEPTA